MGRLVCWGADPVRCARVVSIGEHGSVAVLLSSADDRNCSAQEHNTLRLLNPGVWRLPEESRAERNLCRWLLVLLLLGIVLSFLAMLPFVMVHR